MATCGVWPSGSGLVAVVADDDGKGCSRLVIDGDRDSCGLLQRLDETEGLDWQLVLPEHHRANSLASLAVDHGARVGIAPRRLIDPIRIVAGLNTGPPRRSALLLARIPLSALRVFLRAHRH